MLPPFNEYIGAGYYIHHDGKYQALIRRTKNIGRRWYSGASMHENHTTPLFNPYFLFGPYYFKHTAKKVAMLHLNTLKEHKKLDSQ